MDYVDTIKSSVSMQDVCRTYGIDIKRGEFISCPFHSEKTASCKIYPADRGFYCFGCGVGGSVIDFVKKYFNIDFMDAVNKINDDFNLGLHTKGKITKNKQLQISKQKFLTKQKENMKEKAIKEYQYALSEYIRLDRQLQDYKPVKDCERLDPLFIESLQKIQYANYRLDCAEEELRKWN